MFTGIIEEKGKIINIKQLKDQTVEYTIKAKKVLEEMEIGDSIATNGVCLTITEKGNEYFKTNLLQETLNITNLSKLAIDSNVNLERAMKLSARINGHLVAGHVDKTYQLVDKYKVANDLVLEFKFDSIDQKYLSLKGSITINGTSLTIAKLTNHTFLVYLIPITQEETNLSELKIGDFVNIEFDMIAKYLERLTKHE